MRKFHQLFTDGGARGNPGPAAIGGILLSPTGSIIQHYSKFIGMATNNQAEYAALEFGLVTAKKHNVKSLNCYLDSELVVEQLNRRYRVKDATLAQAFLRIYTASLYFKKVAFYYIPRNQNKKADTLVNAILDKHSL